MKGGPITIKELNMVLFDIVFHQHTRSRKTKNGYSIRCKKGLWSVTAPTKSQAEREAMRYFTQYFEDGEYDN